MSCPQQLKHHGNQHSTRRDEQFPSPCATELLINVIPSREQISWICSNARQLGLPLNHWPPKSSHSIGGWVVAMTRFESYDSDKEIDAGYPEVYQHRPQIAQANLCVINVEKGAAENGVTLRSIFSRNGTQQWHPT